jgi:chromosome segregation protein
MAVAGQNVKSAQAELERVLATLVEANSQRESDDADLSAAITQFESHQTPADPDLTHLEDLSSRVSASRSSEVEARLNLRTLEERVTALAARASALEVAAQTERDSATRAVSRREQRGVAALTAQGVADAAYEALIQIESSMPNLAKCFPLLQHVGVASWRRHKIWVTNMSTQRWSTQVRIYQSLLFVQRRPRKQLM